MRLHAILASMALLTLVTSAHATNDSRLPLSLPMRSFSTGWTHTLHIRPDGSTWAVGNGANGQLGLGFAASSRVDEAQVAIPAGTACAQVSAGGNYSHCIATNGTLWSWGRNDHGQLGVGTTSASPTPLQVGSDTHWRTVHGNYYNSVAIKDNGTLWAWGDNSVGQLGTAQPINVTSPVQIGTGTSWIAGFSGHGLIVALRADGTIWAQGRDDLGQFGRGTANSAGYTTLTQVSTALSGAVWRSVSVGHDYVLAIRDDGRLYAWGSNGSGKLGTGSAAVSSATPTLVNAGPWRSVSAGGDHSLGLKADGTAWGWGSNSAGQLGIGGFVDKNVPTAVQAGAFVQLYAGQTHSSGLLKNGTINHWGSNANVRSGFPSSVTTLDTPSASGSFWRNGNRERLLATGTFDGFTTDGWGVAKSWGRNNSSQLGDQTGNTSNVLIPAQAGAIENGSMSIGPGEAHTMYVTYDGVLRGFGSNTIGELGNNSTSTSAVVFPVQVSVAGPWLKTAAHYEQSFGLKGDGRLYGWGDNADGQLGLGTSGAAVHLPTLVGNSTRRWVAIASAIHSTYGIASDGSLWAWGDNAAGGTDTSPVRVGSANTWVAIAAGSSFAAALTADGKLWTWGSDDRGALGNGTASSATVLAPVAIGGTTRFTSVAAGAFHGLAGTTTGVYAWGDNNSGQLGLNHSSPGGAEHSPVLSLFPAPVLLSAGEYFSIVATSAGVGSAAGNNQYGQLGLGSSGTDVYNPSTVLW